jgi:hypothetical protein
MAETAEDILRESLAGLLGRKVSSTSLAANSLTVDIETLPDEHSELWLWFEPTWHVGCPEGVILGSRQAQVEDKQQHDELGRVAAQLVGRTIERLDLDERTRDIQVQVSGGYWVRTFVSDPNDEEIWYIRDKGRGLAVGASPKQFFVREVQSLQHPAAG